MNNYFKCENICKEFRFCYQMENLLGMTYFHVRISF